MTNEDPLVVAFELSVADRLAGADWVLSAQERGYLERHYPDNLLHRLGLVDPNGRRTAAYEGAAAQAPRELARRLGPLEKRRVLERCFWLAVVDRTFRIGEGQILLEAARALGLSDEEFDAFLGTHPEAHGMSVAVLQAR